MQANSRRTACFQRHSGERVFAYKVADASAASQLALFEAFSPNHVRCSIAHPGPVPCCSLNTTALPATDVELFFCLLDANRPRLQPAFPARLAAVQTRADAAQVLYQFDQDWETGHLYVFGIWHTTTGRYLGDISLRPSWRSPVTGEIGYYLSAEAEGHGYAREALAAWWSLGLLPCVLLIYLSVAATITHAAAPWPRPLASTPSHPSPTAGHWVFGTLHPSVTTYASRPDSKSAASHRRVGGSSARSFG